MQEHMITIKLYALLLIIGCVLISCEADDPKPVLEQELITTITLNFTKQGTSESIVATWKDIDGSGPNPPEVDPIILDAHSRYELTLTLLDESKTPVEDITVEIEDENDEHQFFFLPYEVQGVVFTYGDTDNNGKPVGIKSTINTDHEGIGTLQILLVHEPVKNAQGVAEGNPLNAGGDTDLDTTFELTIVE